MWEHGLGSTGLGETALESCFKRGNELRFEFHKRWGSFLPTEQLSASLFHGVSWWYHRVKTLLGWGNLPLCYWFHIQLKWSVSSIWMTYICICCVSHVQIVGRNVHEGLGCLIFPAHWANAVVAHLLSEMKMLPLPNISDLIMLQCFHFS